ncbi:MAG: hypothetical protein EBT30_04010, partial [Verrucomicrobia bacterium]|nr:hypothetical protein [Verrucomicrobiota bacterium]
MYARVALSLSLLWTASTNPARADTLSIYFPPALDSSTGLTTSGGGSLDGFVVRAGALSGTAGQLIGNLAGKTSGTDILNTINSSFREYGSFSMSDAYLSDPAQAIVTLSGSMNNANFLGKDVYLLFYNNATASAASELGIFRMANREDNPDGSTGIFPTGANATGGRESGFNFTDPDKVLSPGSFLNVIIGQYNTLNNSFALGGLFGGIGQIFNENKTSAVGSAFSEVILNNFGASSFSASGLPAGLSLNPSTGLISGTFAAGTFTITATNSLTGASASKTLTYTASLQPPVITGILPNEATFGSPASITIQINNGATAVSVSGLPGGLTHPGGASLIISGTPTVAGTFDLVITASNAAGSDTQTILLTVLPG